MSTTIQKTKNLKHQTTSFYTAHSQTYHPLFLKKQINRCLNSWKEVQKVSNHCWKRFLKEYLPTLDRQQKWNKATPSLKVNDIVWLLEDITPRGICPLGKITATHPGKDGVTRVCTVKTAYGTFERPAVSLSPVFAP